MRKPPSSWSVILTDNVCWAITTGAPVIVFVAVAIKVTGTIPGSRGRPDTPLDPGAANTVLTCAAALILFLSSIVDLRVARVDPVNPKRAIPLALYADPSAAQSGERPIP